jgi:hypothetical protein
VPPVAALRGSPAVTWNNPELFAALPRIFTDAWGAALYGLPFGLSSNNVAVQGGLSRMDALNLVWWLLMVPTALLWAVVAVLQQRFWASVSRLDDAGDALPAGAGWPTVSVVVPSCNESAHVEAATRALLALNYPALQVVAVNDRSTDDTGAILDRLAREDARLQVVHVSTLPPGWLGKNHANHVGAQAATGQWLLFTDGDVMFSPGALRKAVAAALREDRHHVAVMPLLVCRGLWGRSIQAATFALITVRYRMWELRTPRTRGFAGFGAFNLVAREAYARSGGHTTLRMEVADDLKLGMVLRRSGARQLLLDSNADVSVAWQAGFFATLRGLMKNTFAGTNWQWRWLAPALMVTLLPVWLPLLALGLAPHVVLQALGAFCGVLMVALHARAARRLAGGSGAEGFTYPVIASSLAVLMLVSAVAATWRGGIWWRGTFYRLEDLRRGCVNEDHLPIDQVPG